ncbi:MAG TPA: sulfite exporter TauE/SafE family protein [Pseudolabrys sp.]
MTTLFILSVTAAAFLLAGFVKGAIGLGLPTVAIGLLGIVMTPSEAAAILVLPSLVTNVWQLVTGGDVLLLTRRLWPMLLGVCVGTFVGALTLPVNIPDASTWLGIALIIYASLCLAKVQFKVPPQSETWLGLIVGVLTGVATVATGVFVIPGVPYITAMDFDRNRMVQALGLSFTVSTIALAAALGYQGYLESSIAWPALLALGVALVGMWFGQIVRNKVKAETFRLCFFLGLLALGLHLASRALL